MSCERTRGVILLSANGGCCVTGKSRDRLLYLAMPYKWTEEGVATRWQKETARNQSLSCSVRAGARGRPDHPSNDGTLSNLLPSNGLALHAKMNRPHRPTPHHPIRSRRLVGHRQIANHLTPRPHPSCYPPSQAACPQLVPTALTYAMHTP